MSRLSGKVVLVTGAAGGVGSAAVAAIRREGAIAIATGLQAHNGIDHVLDVTSPDDWQRIAGAVDQAHGRLDGLINAAGIAEAGNIEETDYATWRRVLSVNLDGTFLGCKTALPLLRRRGGSIVNLSSVYGLVGAPHLPAYNASKGGVGLLTKSVALFGARLDPQVRCNAICPSFLEGAMVEKVADSLYPGVAKQHPELVKKYLSRDVPMGRLGRAAEVAEFCVYLVSDESTFVTGSSFTIDGGFTAR